MTNSVVQPGLDRKRGTVAPEASKQPTVEELRGRLQEAEHLSALRAGCLHDVIGALNPLGMALHQVRQRIQELPSERQPALLATIDDAEGALALVRGLQVELRQLTLASPCLTGAVSVEETAGAALRLAGMGWDPRIRVVRDIEPGLCVRVEPVQFFRVLFNVLRNAADALSGKQFVKENPTIWITGRTGPGRKRVTIRDNGPGMPQRIQSHLFTQPVGTRLPTYGSGWGLSVCRRLVECWGGEIDVWSEPGLFCEITLEFPD
jgi:signal transduction histidine kinase